MQQASDAFIQADGRMELLLELVVVPQVVLIQRLLDHQQFQHVQRPQGLAGFQCIGGVGIHLEWNMREGFPNGLGIAHIPPRLDLDLDAPISVGQVFSHPLDQRLGGFLQADRDTHIYARPQPAQ